MENNGKYDKDAEHNVLCPTELEIIGKQLQESREARKRTREEITWGFLEGVDLRRIEEGGGCDFFVLRFLMERLHIPLKLKNFYLSAQDNILVNLESEMEYDLLFWRYGDVNLKLEKYYKLCDHENCLHMLVYYRFYAMLSIWRGSGDKDETREIWNFIKRWMPNFEIRLHNREPFSLDELALIIMYYCLVEEKTEIRLKKIKEVADYYQAEFATKQERYQSFYAVLMLSCARCEYKLGDLINCISSCKEGIRVMLFVHRCVAGGELYELLADAEGKLLEGEIKAEKNREAMLNSSQGKGDREWFKDSEWCQKATKIREYYEFANVLYKTYYFGYREKHWGELEEKIKRWRITV